VKLNVFRIPVHLAGPLRAHLGKNGLNPTATFEQEAWTGEFLFSEDPKPGHIPWVKTFAKYIGDGKYFNRSFFGVMLMAKEESVYAIAFGKAHFYVRPFCDYDFGIEVAKRIADENDVAQTSARRYQGKQTKDIRSFAGQARLSVPPGNSVDFIQARVIASKSATFGESAKFGTSCLLAPDLAYDEVGGFLTALDKELASEARFKLPRTLVLVDEDEIKRYDEKLVDELLTPIGTSDIATSTFDLFGVDFVFSSSGSFAIKCGHLKPLEVDRLTMKDVKEFITDRKLTREQILRIKVLRRPEGEPEFIQSIKEAVDFICDEDLVVLRGGKWLKFNEDYLDALDDAIRRIEVETTEPELLDTDLTEPDFNQGLAEFGYELADKNFDVLKTKAGTPTEAWDHSRGDTVYAVKFGTPQKLNYVVDQAMSVVELIRNRASTQDVPPFKRYCLWLGYRAKTLPPSLADSGSIILKQKVEAWARACEEIGYIPVIKMTRKLHKVHDAATAGGAAD
jgi:uncharacterized protein (TIGR04141 family)